MIFVTVGTHEQPFNRLVEYMDCLKRDNVIQEDVIIQSGYSTYEPKYCIWHDFFSYQEITELVAEARIVITHGGPSSFIMPLQIGKTPIVVPRQKKYNEHINDHQVSFSKEVEKRMGIIVVVEAMNEMLDTIQNYDSIICGKKNKLESNNVRFNAELAKIVDNMF
ncbi:MAG: multidrug MFS transporter [bacterium]|nr:multidrug MFS transporter [bacterium]